MKRSTTTWTLAIAAAALLMLPAPGAAQTPPPSQPPTTQPPATAQQEPTRQVDPAKTDAAREHLTKARAALDDVTTASLSARAKTQVAELKRRINALERTVAANDKASPTATEKRSPTATAGARGAANWGTEVAAIDKTLTELLGPDSATGAPAATGTAGTTAPKSKAAAVELDATTQAKLAEVRTHITAFATVMAGGTPKTPSTEPSAEPVSATATTPPTATPPSTPDPTSPTTPPTPTGTSGTTPAQAAPAQAQPAQADQDAARRHLTEARNTLSALTQLPAASQLTGEARTQVSQLISNFNELITTQSEWRAAYAKVTANLTTLIGPDSGTPDPSAASGTAGAVGTAGTTPSVDPSIRAKLIELRQNLSQFEKAASGTAGAGMTPSAAPASTDPTSPSTPPSSTPPSSTPPSTTPPSSTPPSSTPPSTTPPSSTPATSGETPASQPAGNAEVMRHVAAIEALLKLEDEGGGLTLTKAQVEQLRTHWAALKQVLDKK